VFLCLCSCPLYMCSVMLLLIVVDIQIGWGAYNILFGKNLKKQVFGWDVEKKSSALQDIIPFHAQAYDPSKNAKGDLRLCTDLETWNACLLNALALPALPRLGTCPPELKLRDNLADIPIFDETLYYGSTVSDALTQGSSSPATQAIGNPPSSPSTSPDTTHLTSLLTRDEVLHFARRVGYSIKSLGLEKYFMNYSARTAHTLPALTLQQAISLALSPENTQLGYNGAQVPQPKEYIQYKFRVGNPIKLWSKERREKRNNWPDIFRTMYPRYDPIERRLKRWNLEKFFNMNSLTVDPSNPHIGSLEVKSEYMGHEEQVTMRAQAVQDVDEGVALGRTCYAALYTTDKL